MMLPKKQSCIEAFLKFGFTSVTENFIKKKQHVICCKVFAGEGMKLSKLKQDFESCHGKLTGKSIDYFRENLRF